MLGAAMILPILPLYSQKGLSFPDWPYENGRKEEKASGIPEKARHQKVRKPY
jgi:hypothetical protein